MNQAKNFSRKFFLSSAPLELGKFDYGSNAFVNGKPAAFVLIYQAPGANALSTFDGINKALTELRKSFPKDIDYVMPLETVTVVKVSINEVVHTLLIALLRVVEAPSCIS